MRWSVYEGRGFGSCHILIVQKGRDAWWLLMRSSLSGGSKRNPLVKFIWGKLAVRWSGRQMELLYLTTQVLVFR